MSNNVAQALDAEVRRVSCKPVPRAPEPLVQPDKMAGWFRAQRARASA